MLLTDDTLRYLDHYIWIHNNPRTNISYRIFGDPWSWNKIFSLYGNPDCEIMQLPSELRWLLGKFIKLQPKNVLEIGNAQGGTLYYWLKHSLPNSKVVGVDINHGQIASMEVLTDTKLTLVTGNSTSIEIVNQVKNIFNNAPVDFLFIDGNHNLAQADFDIYSTLVKKGIIAFHDINPNRIAPATNVCWENVKQNNNWEEYCEHCPDDNGLGIGIINI